LVFHEGNEGRDHQRESPERERGNLIAHALASPGRQDTKRVAAREDRAYEFFLPRSKTGIAEVLLQ